MYLTPLVNKPNDNPAFNSGGAKALISTSLLCEPKLIKLITLFALSHTVVEVNYTLCLKIQLKKYTTFP